MPEQIDFVLGFAPGGKDRFGWSVCKTDGDRLWRFETGLTNDAQETIDRVKRTTDYHQQEGNPRVLAAGIDAPMFWSNRGNRAVDEMVRKALKNSGFPSWKVGGTVQAVNGLRGACSVQGVLLGKYLHQTYNVQITEAHPTALLHLLAALGQAGEIEPLIAGLEAHQRDATLAAFTAWSMHKQSAGWRDLYPEESYPVQPFNTPVTYWMPIP